MPINFFDAGCKTDSSLSEFGLCDDISNSPAYIKETDKGSWIAIVTNPKTKYVEFFAIDNCLKIKRADGSLESTCDGLLRESQNLIFVELKERGGGSWFGDGRKQITNTIKLFKTNHNVAEFTSISAYVCNRLKPLSNSGRAVSIQMFKDATGYVLNDKNEIII